MTEILVPYRSRGRVRMLTPERRMAMRFKPGVTSAKRRDDAAKFHKRAFRAFRALDATDRADVHRRVTRAAAFEEVRRYRLRLDYESAREILEWLRRTRINA